MKKKQTKIEKLLKLEAEWKDRPNKEQEVYELESNRLLGRFGFENFSRHPVGVKGINIIRKLSESEIQKCYEYEVKRLNKGFKPSILSQVRFIKYSWGKVE